MRDRHLIIAGIALSAVVLLALILPRLFHSGPGDRQTRGGTPPSAAADEPVLEAAGTAGYPTAADWPAFHRGGPLLGATTAPDAPRPPLKVRWTYRIDSAGVTGGPAVVGRSVYVADDSGQVHSIDLATGRRRWLYKAEDGFSTVPLVAGGRVFVGDKGGYMDAIDARTGGKLWVHDSGDPINSSPNLDPRGRIVFANDGGRVSCLAPDDGKPAWTADLKQQTNGSVAVADGVGWVASCDGNLRSIDLETGQVRDKIDLAAQTGASPVVSDCGIIVGTNANSVLCIDPLTRLAFWKFDKVGANSFVYSTAAVADGVAVAGARDNFVYGLDTATGERLWRFETQGEVDGSAAAAPAAGARGGVVYVGSKDGKFYALGLRDGKLLWQFDAGGEIAASPAVARSVVVLADTGGNVYCLEEKR